MAMATATGMAIATGDRRRKRPARSPAWRSGSAPGDRAASGGWPHRPNSV